MQKHFQNTQPHRSARKMSCREHKLRPRDFRRRSSTPDSTRRVPMSAPFHDPDTCAQPWAPITALLTQVSMPRVQNDVIGRLSYGSRLQLLWQRYALTGPARAERAERGAAGAQGGPWLTRAFVISISNERTGLQASPRTSPGAGTRVAKLVMESDRKRRTD